MSEREEYTPRAKTLQEAYEYWAAGLGGSDGHEVKRFLSAHDRALREQIARAIEAKADDPDPTLEPHFFMAMDIAADIARGERSE